MAERILQHGTTRSRAEAIFRDDPKPGFVEPGGQVVEKEISFAPVEGPFESGRPEHYALLKAELFPDEGGPAVLEVRVPDEIAVLAARTRGEFRFGMDGKGLRELIAAWPSLTKRIL